MSLMRLLPRVALLLSPNYPEVDWRRDSVSQASESLHSRRHPKHVYHPWYARESGRRGGERDLHRLATALCHTMLAHSAPSGKEMLVEQQRTKHKSQFLINLGYELVGCHTKRILSPHRVPGENSVTSSQPMICACQSELTEFFTELTEFAKESVNSLFRNSALETVFRPFPWSCDKTLLRRVLGRALVVAVL